MLAKFVILGNETYGIKEVLRYNTGEGIVEYTICLVSVNTSVSFILKNAILDFFIKVNLRDYWDKL